MLAAENTCSFFLLLSDNEDKLTCTITSSKSITFVVIATTAFFLAQAFSTWWILFESDFNIMLREDQLFWTPMYNSALLEHWIMLARRNEITDKENRYLQPLQTAKNSKLFICTTMYREDDQEMKQLLESFRLFNNHAFRTKGLKIEFHIFFDGAVKAGKPTEYLLQLVVLFEEVFGTNVGFFTKIETPYGLSLSLRLPCDQTEGSNCTIHLKDKFKVKNKKRWSQVMYMKYALEQKIHGNQNSEQSYILTTDADVKFTPKSVEALINLMARDESVGAVCARTHPLGNGLLVWYQIFEYAIGHWFQKASEHVLGTVLCAPGCFSVYRLKAINDVLNLYATNVEKAEEFLTKDMGEDRWLCTLLVQKGWRIEYCATSTNSTHCPEDFDEFFKQRRRWIVSTLANQWLLIKEWSLIKQNNLRVSFLFKIYQIILLVSTLIGPSSVILVVSGGLKFGKDWNSSVTLSIQVAASVGYGIICLYSSSRTQLMIGKLYCCLYTFFMMIALVGTAVEIATDINGQPGAEESFISDDLKLSSTSVYLIGMAAIFLITAVLHLSEFWIIFYGFVYLLGLPSGYLVLMIYSICNITDSSWGTREDEQEILHDHTWKEKILSGIKFLCSCFSRQDNRQQVQESENQGSNKSLGRSIYKAKSSGTSQSGDDTMAPNDCVDPVQSEEDESVETWLQDMPEEAKLLKENGFEKTSFISNIRKEDLKSIGIKDRIKIKKIINMVEQLKDYEIPLQIPENVESWLKQIGLEQYKNHFFEANIKDQIDLEILADCKEDDVKSFHINKRGHIRRFLIAIKALRKPSHAQKKQVEACNAIEEKRSEEQNNEVTDFWKQVGEECLRPRSTVFESDEHLKVKLKDSRDMWLLVFAMINVLWLILISTLADKGKLLGVFGSNPIGFAVIAVYGVVLIIQFFAMIIHRISTFLHFLGIIPYNCGTSYHSNFLFYNSDNALEDQDNEIFKKDIQECHRRVSGRERHTRVCEEFLYSLSNLKHIHTFV
ncbi:chitin synthase chs-2-like isoform X1 [Ruditapes philippinarum]|uniref:chitin synthase chs-2-like isoform X1 n=1 Tax=Ruditapes philippinarum TaxID=129788 RepID=UPI00295BA924|nr:chitin synthase chs-2-like isoform X1 [Ruditapes philippinarum]